MELPKNANKTASPENNPAADPKMSETLSLGNPVSAGFEPPVEGGEGREVPVQPEVNQPMGNIARTPSALDADDIAAIRGSLAPKEVTPTVKINPVKSTRLSDDEAQAIRQAATSVREPKKSFYEVSAQLPDVDDKRTQQINELSRKLKLPKEQILGLLQSKTYEELNSTAGLEDVLLSYPGLYSWAKNPDNYKLLVKAPEQAKRIEDNSEFLKKAWDETSRLAKSNSYQLMQVSLHSMMSTGKLEIDYGVQKLQELDELIKGNQTSVYEEGVQKLASHTREC